MKETPSRYDPTRECPQILPLDVDIEGCMRVDHGGQDVSLDEEKEEEGEVKEGVSSSVLKETTISTSLAQELSSGSWKPPPWSIFQPHLRRGPFY
jgi:hypothetical protein